MAIVASSAFGALSLVCQAHADVKRAEKLTWPVSLFILVIGDSGERKTTCDGFFVTAVREYQEQQAKAIKPDLERHDAEMDTWSAERNGILEAIKAAGKSGKSTDDLRASLAQPQHDKPEAPSVPRLLLGDETPENLTWRLAKQWPSAGVVIRTHQEAADGRNGDAGRRRKDSAIGAASTDVLTTRPWATPRQRSFTGKCARRQVAAAEAVAAADAERPRERDRDLGHFGAHLVYVFKYAFGLGVHDVAVFGGDQSARRAMQEARVQAILQPGQALADKGVGYAQFARGGG